MINGWIKIDRALLNHWLFKDPNKLRAWLIILMEVNYIDKKVIIGERLLLCKRGDSLRSLDNWAKLFGKGWNKSKVRRFFSLLESDTMIVTKSERKTTRLTVCNYDAYQDERNASETQVKRKRNATETQVTPTKEREERKKDKNIPELREFGSFAKSVYLDDLKKNPDPYKTAVLMKYKAWVEAGWKDGNGKPIKNWKSKLRNTIPHLTPIQDDSNYNPLIYLQ